jgi:hypothetical protein
MKVTRDMVDKDLRGGMPPGLILALTCLPVGGLHANPQSDRRMVSDLVKYLRKQHRTQESDEAFRNRAPPLGSVRLSNSALELVRQVRRTMPEGHQIAWIGWTKERQYKEPNDTNWKNEGAGWVLGAYARNQVPPDVIDKVDGVEIIFSADPPSSLVGKTLDVSDQNLFVRD